MESAIRKAVIRIKENLKEERNANIRLGLYMSLQTIKNELEIENIASIDKLELQEDLEKYL